VNVVVLLASASLHTWLMLLATVSSNRDV